MRSFSPSVTLPDTLYEGGFLKAELIFPPEYPLLPPKMKFITPMWHPNIYADGTVCISILHAPGKDEWGYEDASERWLPVHTVESIVRILNLLMTFAIFTAGSASERYFFALIGQAQFRQPC